MPVWMGTGWNISGPQPKGGGRYGKNGTMQVSKQKANVFERFL